MPILTCSTSIQYSPFERVWVVNAEVVRLPAVVVLIVPASISKVPGELFPLSARMPTSITDAVPAVVVSMPNFVIFNDVSLT